MTKYTLKILWCEHRKIFKVCLAIFQHYAWNGQSTRSGWLLYANSHQLYKAFVRYTTAFQVLRKKITYILLVFYEYFAICFLQKYKHAKFVKVFYVQFLRKKATWISKSYVFL